MNVKLMLKLLLILAVGNACAQPNESSDDYTHFSLSWNPPKTFSNGSRLSVSRDLKGYHVYYGSSRETVREKMISVPASSDKLSLGLLDSQFVKQHPVIYLAMSSISKSGVESELTEIIFFLP